MGRGSGRVFEMGGGVLIFSNPFWGVLAEIEVIGIVAKSTASSAIGVNMC